MRGSCCSARPFEKIFRLARSVPVCHAGAGKRNGGEVESGVYNGRSCTGGGGGTSMLKQSIYPSTYDVGERRTSSELAHGETYLILDHI